jgi:hypothetical protein
MAETAAVDETLLRIQQHDAYFCRALEMVPRHLTTEVNIQEQLNTKYFKVRVLGAAEKDRFERGTLCVWLITAGNSIGRCR